MSAGTITVFCCGLLGQLAEGLDIFLGDEVVDGVDVALGDGVGHHLGGLGLGLGGALARLGVAEGGFACGPRPPGSPACLAPSARVMAACFSPSASVITARRSRSAFIWRAMALVMSGGGVRSLISMRVTFTPQGLVAWSMVVQQAGVDLVALGQHLVQVHRADHGAQVGHGQLGDGVSRDCRPDRRPGRRPSPG